MTTTPFGWAVLGILVIIGAVAFYKMLTDPFDD